MKKPSVCLAVLFLFLLPMLVVPAFAYPDKKAVKEVGKGHKKQWEEKRPLGWDKGKKTGWDGGSEPPGFQKAKNKKEKR